MKTSTKRSLNRCKNIWVVKIDYCKHSLTVSDYLSNLFSVWARVNRYWAHILINISVLRDFISFIFTKRAKISPQKKSNIYEVTTVDNKLLLYNKKMIDYKTEEIRLQIRSYVKNMQFNITLMWYECE